MSTDQKTPHWIPCPACNEKVEIKVYADTALFNFPLQSPHCHNETVINVFQLKMAEVEKQNEKNS